MRFTFQSTRKKNALAIAKSFRPAKSDGVREKIRLDIDRLVYSSANLEDLLRKLQERGYEIKRGKYLAVKSPTAERFVRLKTLGEDYAPNCLEKRIADREKFPNAVREKLNTANAIERKFHATILNLTVEISRFRLSPKRTTRRKSTRFRTTRTSTFLPSNSEQYAIFTSHRGSRFTQKRRNCKPTKPLYSA